MAKVKTTMSVSEMQRMLGLSKTEAYWLVHKNVFDTIIVEKKMRVVIASFEKWYANQLRRSKVNGPPPGADLRACSLSVKETFDIEKFLNTRAKLNPKGTFFVIDEEN